MASTGARSRSLRCAEPVCVRLLRLFRLDAKLDVRPILPFDTDNDGDGASSSDGEAWGVVMVVASESDGGTWAR